MKKRVFILAACFFLVCCVLNLVGRFANLPLANIVKPALMPLLALTTIVVLGGIDSKKVFLLIAAQLFGFAGDTLLIGDGFPFFAGGIGAFLVGHIFYITLFSKAYKGLKPVQWVISIAVMAVLVAALIILIGVKGALLPPMAVYGSALMMLIFCGFMGVIRKKGCEWGFILAGGILFTFSDAQIALDTFGTQYPYQGFVIMLTYLAAQALLAIGSVKLIKRDA